MKKNEFDKLEKQYRRVQADVRPALAAYIEALQPSVPKTSLIQRLQETTSFSFQERLTTSINQAVDTPTLSAVNQSKWSPEVEHSAYSLPEALLFPQATISKSEGLRLVAEFRRTFKASDQLFQGVLNLIDAILPDGQ